MKPNLKYLTMAVVLIVTLASCKKDAAYSSNGLASSSTLSTTVDPIDVTDCSSAAGIDKIICLANAFKAQLDATQLAAVQRTYSKTDAQKWSNLPQALVRNDFKRVGLNFGSMTTTQIQYAKALVKEVSGVAPDEGWDELQQLLNADEYLAANGGGSIYGEANYYIALLGTPATTGTFEIQFGGHHTAFANTYKDGVLAGATPSFRGVEPFGTFTWNGKGNQPLAREKDAFSDMLNSLSESELATAKLNGIFSNLLVGPQKDGAFPTTPSGLKCSNVSNDKRSAVAYAIMTYVADVDPANAVSIMTRYINELDNTYISYSGTTGMTARNDYVRIDGPSVWIEYSSQGGIVLPATHPHSVWRDKTMDYGGN